MPIVLMVKVFVNGLGDGGSISSQVIPKTQKMVLNASLLNTQYYKVWIKGKWSNPGKEIVLSLYLSVVAFEKVAFSLSSIMLSKLT